MSECTEKWMDETNYEWKIIKYEDDVKKFELKKFFEENALHNAI